MFSIEGPTGQRFLTRSRLYTDSGLSLDVSSADGDLTAEISDAITFLTTHEAELRRLHEFPGVTDHGGRLRVVPADNLNLVSA